MKTTARFDKAIQKLYTAYLDNNLNPECCKQCAVGTILDGKDSWKHLSNYHGSLELNYVGQVHESFGRTFNGYTPSELLLIEQTFLKSCGYQVPLNYKNTKPLNLDNNSIFEALFKTFECLLELDDYSFDLNIKDIVTRRYPKNKMAFNM